MNQRIIEGINFLESTCTTQRSKAMLDLAEKRGLRDATILAADGRAYPLVEYAVQLICFAYTIGKPENADSDSYIVTALLISMARINHDTWSPVSKLILDTTRSGLVVSRNEWDAVMAQCGTFETSPDKGTLLTQSMMGTIFYCADLLTRIISLTGVGCAPPLSMPADLLQKYQSIWQTQHINGILSNLASTFIPAYLGETAYRDSLKPMLDNLINSGSTSTAPGNVLASGEATVSLGQHIINTIWRMVDIFNPQTESDLGRFIMAGICYDIRKVSDYHPIYGTRKAYSDQGQYSEPDGRKFNWEQVVRFEAENQIPLGHNKTLFMLCRYLGSNLPEEIASAVDSFQHNLAINPLVEQQMMKEPLGLYLHIGYIMATYHDDLRKN